MNDPIVVVTRRKQAEQGQVIAVYIEPHLIGGKFGDQEYWEIMDGETYESLHVFTPEHKFADGKAALQHWIDHA